jgi:hypothetical protein
VVVATPKKLQVASCLLGNNLAVLTTLCGNGCGISWERCGLPGNKRKKAEIASAASTVEVQLLVATVM